RRARGGDRQHRLRFRPDAVPHARASRPHPGQTGLARSGGAASDRAVVVSGGDLRVGAEKLVLLETALREEGGRQVRSVWLPARGARLHAWLVFPTTRPPWPLVVMAHGWAAVKEMNLDY